MNRYAPNGQLCWTSATSTSSPSCSTVPTSATTFNYDLNGNRTSSTSPLSSTSLSWQSTSGRLVCVNTAGTSCSTTLPSATTTLYSYDGEGHRTASSNNGVTNAFIWDTGASQLLADSTHDYVYLQGSVSPDLQINLTTGTVDLLIQDQNANTRGVVQVTGANSALNGTIVNYTDFDAYGNAITQSGGSINPGGMANGGVTTDISTSFAFGAGYWDSSNLTYLVHRYLDNETGQFISVDPLVDQTREAYVYAGDGPVMTFDALGLCDWTNLNPFNSKGCVGSTIASTGKRVVQAFKTTAHFVGVAAMLALDANLQILGVHISAKDLVDRVESKISSVGTWVGEHAGRVINFVGAGAQAACSFFPVNQICSIILFASAAVDIGRLIINSKGRNFAGFAKEVAFVLAKHIVLALPGKLGDEAIRLASKPGQIAFTRLQAAFIKISTSSPEMIDKMAAN